MIKNKSNLATSLASILIIVVLGLALLFVISRLLF